jgi:hypothetical protein
VILTKAGILYYFLNNQARWSREVFGKFENKITTF